MSERSFDDFDEFAKDYRNIHSQNVKISGADSLYFAEHKIKELMKFEEDGELKMLDVGCGDGAIEMYTHKYFPTWFTEGIDISEKSISRAKERKVTNAHFTLYDGKNIPFRDNSFDVAFVAAVLHHIHFAHHHNFVKEIYRVTKKGGRVYLFEHNPLNPATRYLVKTCVFDKDARLLSHRYAERLLREGAFAQVEKKFILFFPRGIFFSFLIKMEGKLSWLPLGAQYYLRAVK